jgi:hypothetical protein
MKTYQFAGHTILCGQAGEWESLLRQGGDEAGTVIDLRTLSEIGDRLVPKAPEGWGYRRLPLTGQTISEQDLDVFRREFFRKPRTVVVGPTALRPSLLVEASLARLERSGWDYPKRAAENGEEPELFGWLTAYLVRHGCEPKSSLDLITASGQACSPSTPPGLGSAGAVDESADSSPSAPAAPAASDTPAPEPEPPVQTAQASEIPHRPEPGPMQGHYGKEPSGDPVGELRPGKGEPEVSHSAQEILPAEAPQPARAYEQAELLVPPGGPEAAALGHTEMAAERRQLEQDREAAEGTEPPVKKSRAAAGTGKASSKTRAKGSSKSKGAGSAKSKRKP